MSSQNAALSIFRSATALLHSVDSRRNATLTGAARALSQGVLAAVLLCFAATPVAAHQGSAARFSAPETVSADNKEVIALGAVHDLVVNNQLTGIVSRYLGLRLDDGSAVSLRGAGLGTLVAGQRIEATGSLSGTSLLVSSTRVVAGVPVRQAVNSKIATSVQGKLAVAHADYFSEGRGDYSVHIIADDGKATVLHINGNFFITTATAASNT